VINQLQADESLGEAVREVALQIANSGKGEDAEKLRREAMKVLCSPDKNVETYRAALEKTNKANDLEPNDASILTTLGAGLYRIGSYEDALKTLTNVERILSEAGEGPDPWNLAFKAMALYRMGSTDEARTALEQLRELCKDRPFFEDIELQTLLSEAEKLIAGEKQ
jgi:tetratricopeptide (TPR) repeat protein